jgi:hypothetical protein
MRPLAILCLMLRIAHAGSNEISLFDTTRGLPSASAPALTETPMLGGGLTYARRLGAPLDELTDLQLWVGGGFELGSTSGTLFQTISTGIDTLSLFGLVRARYPLVRDVHASARVGLGSSRAALDLTDPARHTRSDSGWSAFATEALGLEVTSRESGRMAVGLRLELGYTRVTSAAITPAADAPSDMRLKMSQTSFGHLDLSGPFLSFSLISVF